VPIEFENSTALLPIQGLIGIFPFRAEGYSCPFDGSYLIQDPNNPGWVKCPGCNFRRKKLS